MQLGEAQPARPLGPGARLGRFEIVTWLGSGGMGAVYAAHDPTLDRKVALKILHDRSAGPLHAAEARARLLREAQAMARLAHPNVIAVHEVGTVDDQVFLVMELVEGQTLASWLAGGERSWREVLELFAQAGRGLAAAHCAGLVHRDFKPENVLVGADGRARVTDFGLVGLTLDEAATADRREPVVDRLTRTGARLGTPAYMAPEQHRGAALDARTDQFSFCVALYEALYGQRPFPGETYRELVRAVYAGAVSEPPRGTRVPRRVHQAVLQGLRPDPGHRHGSMDALLGELVASGAAPGRRARMLGLGIGVATLAVAALLVTSSAFRPAAPGEANAARATRTDSGAPPPATPVRLTQLSGCAYMPAFADADTVVFDRTVGGDVDLWAVSRGGGGARQLTSASGSEWRAVRGRRPGEVAYVSLAAADALGTDALRLAFLDLASGTSEIAELQTPTAAVAGDTIYYVRLDGAEIRRLDGQLDEPLVGMPPGWLAYTIAVSADGRRLGVVTSAERSAPAVCVVELERAPAALDCLVTDGVLGGRVDFSPDGEVLYYAAVGGVRRRQMSTGVDELLVPGASASGGIAASPDGAALIWSDCASRADLLEVGRDPARVAVQGPLADAAVGPHDMLTYVRGAPGARVVAVRRASGVTRDVTTPELGEPATPALDVDGRRVAFRLKGWARERSGIYVADVTPYPPEQLTTGDFDTGPVWTLDGRLAFTRWDDRHTPSVHLVDPAGGTPAPAHPRPRITWDLNRHTGELLLMGASYSDLYLWDPRTGVERPVDLTALRGAFILKAAVSADGRWVLATAGVFGESLWRIPVDGGMPAHVFQAEHGQTAERPVMLEDGRLLASPATWIGDLYTLPLRP